VASQATPQALAAARLRARQFEEFFEAMPDGLVEMDIATFSVTLLNAAARRQLGYTPEDVAGGSLLAISLVREDFLPVILETHSRLAGPSITTRTPYQRTGTQDIFEWVLRRKDGSEFPAEVEGSYVLDSDGIPVRGRYLFRDITGRKRAEEERLCLIKELQETLDNVHTLSGLLPICAVCKNVRDDRGYWTAIESYMRKHTAAEFAHALCPTCREEVSR